MFKANPFSPLSKQERASILANNALAGRFPSVDASASMWGHRIYHSAAYRWLYLACAFLHCLLAWWEPPSKAVEVAGGADAPPAPVDAIRGVDFLFLTWALLDTVVLQRQLYGNAVWRRGWVRVKLAALLALAVNLIIVVAAAPGAARVGYFARVVRPVLLIERMANVRKVALQMVAAAPRVASVFVLLLAHLALSAVAAFVLFAGIDDNADPPSCTPFRRQGPPQVCTAFNASLRFLARFSPNHPLSNPLLRKYHTHTAGRHLPQLFCASL